ncbi:MAG: TIM barrel protein [Candidatus Methanofastidiosa archaeon]|nr:TIM barrel protein [Candidatus Methanofastidiosa archaeon]
MKTILAINNSPYYYFRPSNQRSIGYSLPLTDRIVSKLSEIMARITDDMEASLVPGIQLGSESDRAIMNKGKIDSLRKIAKEKGIEYIVHLPDQLVPGTYIKRGFQERLLGLIQGAHGKDKNDFEREVCKRISAASELGSKYMVLHLPNGPLEDPSTIKDYLGGCIKDLLNETGICICIENCNNKHGPYYGDIGRLSELVSDLGNPYEMCFDYGHYLVDGDGRKIEDARSLCSWARVLHVHINDRAADRHLLLGERPRGLDCEVLEKVEKDYIEGFLPFIDPDGKVFVLERNKPFSYGQLRASAEKLVNALSL